MALSKTGPERSSRGPIGLIGLGLIGNALTHRFLAQGFEVIGLDVDPSAVEAFAALGGNAAREISELAGRCPRIVLSLPNSEIVERVLAQLDTHLTPGHLIVDTTTGSPESAQANSHRLAKRGAIFVEAMISGNSSQVRQGEVLVMASGTTDAIAQCRDLFACFASQVHHVGETGNASKMKLVTNLVLGLNRAALAEGLVFADKLGLDLTQSLTILRDSTAYSRVMDTKGDKMINGNFEPQARLSQHLKDVRLMIEAATNAGQRLPLSETHQRLLEESEQLGLGQLDNSAIFRAIEAQRVSSES